MIQTSQIGGGGFGRNFGGGAFARIFSPRVMYNATCSECGIETEVPFRPSEGKTLYCRECFKKNKRYSIFEKSDARLPLVDFEFAGIVDQNGQPAERKAVVPEPIALIVCEINNELIDRLRANPELMRSLPPRKFEELIAELLHRQGCDVQLTPCTRDGGLDIYAAKKDNIGRFLFLVECKRYCPPNKVEVGVVRALYGVVQEKRATAGIIATTSFFTADAKEFQQRVQHQMHLHDYDALQEWLVGV